MIEHLVGEWGEDKKKKQMSTNKWDKLMRKPNNSNTILSKHVEKANRQKEMKSK
ncbi:unnamed protein product [Dovyalis caffra]|uniref:Uncharacterized protein n=1 Tax=Dovyalis caffra TaxID=77055 RepID=A0AAV1R0Y6_9ROSI|nr:unnamed protein product [Dovyalis caffra]